MYKCTTIPIVLSNAKDEMPTRYIKPHFTFVLVLVPEFSILKIYYF